MASPSAILNRVPPPARIGTTTTAARARNGRTSGTDPVTRVVYNLGDQVFQPSGIQGKVELKADI